MFIVHMTALKQFFRTILKLRVSLCPLIENWARS